MSEKQRTQPVIRFICLYVAFLLPHTVIGDRRHNAGRAAMIEGLPRQDTILPPGERDNIRHQTDDLSALDKFLHGVYAKAGPMQNAVGALKRFPTCEKDDEEFVKEKNEEDFIALMHYPSSEESNDTAECLFVLDRVKKAVLFGASAIIILTMNPNILQELDVVLLVKRPVVVMDNIGNITEVLRALKRVIKFKVKVTHVPSLYDTETFTIWSACWRARPGSGVVCMSDSRLSKAGSSMFWSYFFSALAVIILLLLITCNGLLYEREENWDNQSIGLAGWQRLSCLKIKRYRRAVPKFDDSERDTCAICLEDFYPRQKIRILPCIHEFHTKCIDPWLVRRPFCPLCKTTVSELKRFGSIFQNPGW